ncbi:MAG TPA: hypothetical protein VK678_17845, partial [Bradyrhizobium sp.]|nr:hypothetical protein [Bradyrhizobium sp.]
SRTYHQAANEGCLGSRFERVPMCDKCDELDKKIDHYRLILLSIGDQVTVDRIKVLIGDLQRKKQHFILSKSSRPP